MDIRSDTHALAMEVYEGKRWMLAFLLAMESLSSCAGSFTLAYALLADSVILSRDRKILKVLA